MLGLKRLGGPPRTSEHPHHVVGYPFTIRIQDPIAAVPPSRKKKESQLCTCPKVESFKLKPPAKRYTRFWEKLPIENVLSLQPSHIKDASRQANPLKKMGPEFSKT